MPGVPQREIKPLPAGWQRPLGEFFKRPATARPRGTLFFPPLGDSPV
jgi:hypothetical protein